MDADWRPTQGTDPAATAGGVDPNAPAGGDWQPQPEARSRIVNKIMETLKKHVPASLLVQGPEGLNDLRKVAVGFEEKIYAVAANQSDYLRKISLKMLSLEKNTQQAPGNAHVIPNQNIPSQGSKSRASWTNGQTEMLVVMMKECADVSQYHGKNGWTKEGWNFMATRLNKQFTTANFTVKQVTYRAQRLKRDYSIVKSILDRSGFGWDSEKKVPKSMEGKWDELSQEQRKWRFKEFPHYDDLHGIFEGQTIQGKRCKRTTDVPEEKCNSLPFAPHEEILTEQVLRASRLNSPSTSLKVPAIGDGDYDQGRDEKYKLPEAPPIKRAKDSKGSDEGKPKKGKDVAIDNLVAVKKEELETYKDVKTNQTESYRGVKMAAKKEELETNMDVKTEQTESYRDMKMAAKKEELEIYKDVRTKQTESYRDMAWMGK